MKTIAQYVRYFRNLISSENSGSTRDKDRYQRALWAIGANFFSRIANMVVMIFAIKLTIPYLGIERFGAWMAIISMVALLSFMDLGIGNAIINRVSKIKAMDEQEKLEATISGSVAVLCVVSVIIAILLVGLASIVPWNKIIKVGEVGLDNEVKLACVAFAVIFGMNVFNGGVQKIFYGLQRSHEAHYVNLVVNVLSFGLMLFVVNEKLGISPLLWATIGCQQVAALPLLWRLHKQGFLKISKIKSGYAEEKDNLIVIGKLFLVLQLSAIAATGIDGLLITNIEGASGMASYALVQRIFQFIVVPLVIINSSLWPAYADAHARGETNFIVATLRKSIVFTGGFAMAGGFLLLIIGVDLINFWGSNKVNVGRQFLVIFFIWSAIEALGHAYSMMLNGCNAIRIQIIAVALLIPIGTLAKVIGIYRFGVEGLIVGWAISYIIIVVPIYSRFWKNLKTNPDALYT